jgi:hypothetical protein
MSRKRLARTASVLAVGVALLGGGAFAAVYAGAFRRSAQSTDFDVEFSSKRLRPVAPSYYTDAAGVVHYGLWFDVPDSLELGRLAKRSRWRTGGSEHQDINYWELTTGDAAEGRRLVQMLVPRSWLIRSGFLNPLAAAFPRHQFQLWNQRELLGGFWLLPTLPSATQRADEQRKMGNSR